MRTFHYFHYIVYLPLLFAGLSASGCRGPLEMTVAGEPQLNGGNAAVVRIFGLRNDTNFRSATLESFWQDPQAALGNEYVDQQQLLLYPDQVQTIPLDLDKEVKFIGIAADLRRPDEDRWREIMPVRDMRGRTLHVSVGENRLTVDLRK